MKKSELDSYRYRYASTLVSMGVKPQQAADAAGIPVTLLFKVNEMKNQKK